METVAPMQRMVVGSCCEFFRHIPSVPVLCRAFSTAYNADLFSQPGGPARLPRAGGRQTYTLAQVCTAEDLMTL